MKILCSILLTLLCSMVAAQDYVEAAKSFLLTLTGDQRKKAVYPYADSERFNWNFVPTSRNGISFHDFTPEQEKAAVAFLRVSLSDQGYKKASGIIALENVLKEIEGRSKEDSYRDARKYYFTIFGDPSTEQRWFVLSPD